MDDTYITLKDILKISEDKQIICQFIFATKFIILHTGYFPALCDPTLLISIFNYSFKLEDVFYAPYNAPYLFMKNETMLQFHSTCKIKQSSRIFMQNITDDSPIGHILQYIDMTGTSKYKVDNELRRGKFVLFMKKEYYKQSVHIGK